ncbi:NUDIX hydrolase [Marinobacter lipolyticus]|uniref:NUDIX hydrolase n=1 Tax=Marinobacter lipolyticus TaxID=209639 RepID=UPI003A8FCC6A
MILPGMCLASALGAHRPKHLVETPRSAAVVLVLVNRPRLGPALLLTRRHAGMRNYANDWCLPGGRRDSEDASLLACAWRELREETGINPLPSALLAELDDFYDGKGELVRPFVCQLSEASLRTSLSLQTDETSEWMLLPFSDLFRVERDSEGQTAARRQPAYLLELKNGQGLVWGLTASILRHFLNVLTGSDSPLCKGERFHTKECTNEQ